MTRKVIFDAIKQARGGGGFTDIETAVIDDLLDRVKVPRDAALTPFEAALAAVLKHEGGYVHHPRDPGGATNKGVTQATYDDWRESMGLVDRSVRLIEPAEIAEIYRGNYWEAVSADKLAAGVGYAVFDFGVNSGPARAKRFLQRAARVADDGEIGAVTIAAVARDPKGVIERLCEARLAFVRSLDTHDTFGRGWESRIAEVRKLALEMAR